HSGLGANENEYRWLGTSQAQPGYTLSRQVPPMSWPRSRTTKSSWPARSRATAMAIPENPLPITATSAWAGSGDAASKRVWSVGVVVMSPWSSRAELGYTIVGYGSVTYSRVISLSSHGREPASDPSPHDRGAAP